MTREEFVNTRWEYEMEVKVTNDLINGEELEVAGVDFMHEEVTVWGPNRILMTCSFYDVEIVSEE